VTRVPTTTWLSSKSQSGTNRSNAETPALCDRRNSSPILVTAAAKPLGGTPLLGHRIDWVAAMTYSAIVE